MTSRPCDTVKLTVQEIWIRPQAPSASFQHHHKVTGDVSRDKAYLYKYVQVDDRGTTGVMEDPFVAMSI